MRIFFVALVSVILSTASLSYSKPAQADDLLASLCNYVKANDKSRLRKKLKSAKVKLRNIYEGLTCNGKSLLVFAMENDSQKVGVYIVKRLPGKVLRKTGDVDQANGAYAGSEIATAILERAAK